MNENELIQMLHWYQPEKSQEEAVCALAKIYTNPSKKLDNLFMLLGKHSWENYCRIVPKTGENRHTAIYSLLGLLGDMTWPGAYQAVDVLSIMETEDLIPKLEEIITKAYNNNDPPWLAGLKILVTQLQPEVYALLDKDTIEYLKKADY